LVGNANKKTKEEKEKEEEIGCRSSFLHRKRTRRGD
jgi:hypothetical protein